MDKLQHNSNNRFSVFKKLGNLIVLPRILVNLLRNEEELTALGTNKLIGTDNLNDVFIIISKRLNEQKNLINDNKSTLDRYSNIIDNKNDKIEFRGYSANYPDDVEYSNEFLKKSITTNTGNVDGIIVDEDSGIEVSEIISGEKNFIKLNFDDTKLKGINFISDVNSSIQINWDESQGGYMVSQNTLALYESAEPETEIIIDHNLGTKAIDVKVFKIDPMDIDLKYPIQVGMQYPSDNQLRLFLTEAQKVHVLISRI